VNAPTSTQAQQSPSLVVPLRRRSLSKVMPARAGLRRSLLAAASAAAIVLVSGCATAELSIDSSARVTGTISVDVSKESLASANVTTVDGFKQVIEARLATSPGAGQLFSGAVYTDSDSGYNVTTTYSKAAFDDSAKTFARIAGTRIAFSMDTAVFDPALLGIPAPAATADAIDLSTATVTVTVKFPGKLYRYSKTGATRVDAKTVKWEGTAVDLGVVTASSRRR
jgi:hypothetical protein